MRRRATSTLFILACLTLLTLGRPVVAAPAPSGEASVSPRQSWRCLPPETHLIVRLPRPLAFLEALRSRTRLGAAMFPPGRIDWAGVLTRNAGAADPEPAERLGNALARLGLRPDDAAALLDGEAGFGVMVIRRDEKPPLPVFLAWFEPSQDLAERAIKAVQVAHERQKDEPAPTRRIDLSFDGVEAMRFSQPVIALDSSAFRFEVPRDFREMTAEERNEWYRKQYELRARLTKPVLVDVRHFAVARLGRRILVAGTLPNSAALVRRAAADVGATADIDGLSGAEELTSVFARFLRAHTSPAEEQRAAASRVASLPGVAEALPAGTPLFELLADMRGVPTARERDPMVSFERVVREMMIRAAGPVAMRAALDGDVLRIGAFVSAPSPRGGLFALLDQAPLKPEPADWVPARAQSYTQFSCDLGRAYARYRELVVARYGESQDREFKKNEEPYAALESPLVSVLSSLGLQHVYVTYATPEQPPRSWLSRAMPARRRQTFSMDDLPPARALVWQVGDEERAPAAMRFVREFASIDSAGEGATATEATEQGFTGLRIRDDDADGGLFAGRGYVALTQGSGVTEAVLADLRNPPKGDDALKASVYARRAAVMLGQRPGFYFSFEKPPDKPRIRLAKFFGESIIQWIDGFDVGPFFLTPPGRAAFGDYLGEVIAPIRSLVAGLKDERFRDTIGVNASHAYVTPHGVVIEAAVELPPVSD